MRATTVAEKNVFRAQGPDKTLANIVTSQGAFGKLAMVTDCTHAYTNNSLFSRSARALAVTNLCFTDAP